MQIYFLFLIALSSIYYATAVYSPSDPVIELTPTDFDKQVLQDDSIWIVEFYAPWCGDCKIIVPEYKKAAEALKGIIKLGAIDADQYRSFGDQYGIVEYPTIKIFGQNKKSPTDFQGQLTARGIAEAGLAEAKRKVESVLGGGSSSDSGSDSSNVIELTDSNFDKLVLQSDDVWLVEFFAPWCGHCKNLAPHWEKAANELKGKVKLGTLDATIHQVKASQYAIKGYPTIKFFAAGKKHSSDAADYEGGRTASDIVTWALDVVLAEKTEL